ncbi:MAG: BCAM0308 family protein [Actinobacteria bacterium]|nr:BCAM0308 family protein [Actinomycetota bacterium]
MTLKICERCTAVFDGHKWYDDPEKHRALARRGAARVALCPGDERLEKRRVDGVVHLSGGFLRGHKEEAVNLIHNISEKHRHRNVAARLFEVKDADGGITVETTEVTLAEKIGKEFEKAFSGDLNISWLQGADFVRVKWRRD